MVKISWKIQKIFLRDFVQNQKGFDLGKNHNKIEYVFVLPKLLSTHKVYRNEKLKIKFDLKK